MYVGTTLTVIGASAFAAITATSGTFSGTVTAPQVQNSSGSFIINNTGVVTSKALSGNTLTVQGVKSGSTSVLCIKTTGVIGRCTSAVAADSECTCS